MKTAQQIIDEVTQDLEIKYSLLKEDFSQRKKDEDSSCGNHLEARSTLGEEQLAGNMPKDADNPADTYRIKMEDTS